MSNFDNILAFEENRLSEADTVIMFQSLVDSGDIWRLPDSYQQNAALLYHYGKISLKASPKTLN